MRDEIAKPKQETLEEAAENYSWECSKIREPRFIALDGFIEGAKSDAARDYWFKIFKEQFIVNSSGK